MGNTFYGPPKVYAIAKCETRLVANPYSDPWTWETVSIAAPTIVKEPEKPAEETSEGGVEGEAAAASEGGEAAAPAKEGEAAKKDEKSKEGAADKKPAAEKKPPEKKK